MSAAFATALVVLSIGQLSTEEERKAEAGRFLERGNGALQGGDAAGALEAYRAAYDAFPSPKIFFNMAEAHRELGELVEAADLYQRVSTELPADSPLVSAAQERLTALDTQLGHVSVSTDPPGARIEIGGREVGDSPVTDVRVPSGEVEIKATLEGRTQAESITVEAGGTRSVEIALPETVAFETPPLISIEEEEGEPPITEKWWFWTAIVGGVLVAGTVTALIATSGDDFVPMGELGSFSIDEFDRR